jgi:hypothetical protein
MYSRVPTFLIFAMIFTTCAAGQSQRWSVILISGDTISDCKLLRLSPGTLYAAQSSGNIAVSLESICSLEPDNNPEIWMRSIAGGFLGLLTGAIVGAAENHFKDSRHYTADERANLSSAVLIGFASGAVFGGILGYANPPQPLFLSEMTTQQKVSTIQPYIPTPGKHRRSGGGSAYHPRPRGHR